MASKLVSLRVDEDLWEAVGEYAKAWSTTKTAVVEAALERALGEGERPVRAAASSAPAAVGDLAPGVVRGVAFSPPAKSPRGSVRSDALTEYERMMRARQVKLNGGDG